MNLQLNDLKARIAIPGFSSRMHYAQYGWYQHEAGSGTSD